MFHRTSHQGFEPVVDLPDPPPATFYRFSVWLGATIVLFLVPIAINPPFGPQGASFVFAGLLGVGLVALLIPAWWPDYHSLSWRQQQRGGTVGVGLLIVGLFVLVQVGADIAELQYFTFWMAGAAGGLNLLGGGIRRVFGGKG